MCVCVCVCVCSEWLLNQSESAVSLHRGKNTECDSCDVHHLYSICVCVCVCVSHRKHCFVLLTDASQSEGCTASFTCDNGRSVDLCISLLCVCL